MKIDKDNFYEKMNELKCSSCGMSAEYFFDHDESPLCETCTFEALKDDCNELREINELEDENEDDVEVANKLWEEQEQHHNDSKINRSK